MILKMIIGTVIGGLLGFLYYKKIGCPSGSCPITSNPFSSTIYGALLGFMVEIDSDPGNRIDDNSEIHITIYYERGYGV